MNPSTDFPGIELTDATGAALQFTCGKGMDLVTCDDANPQASCPELPNPICIRISIAGMNLVGCGQRCTP
jgi:hypothetical protein